MSLELLITLVSMGGTVAAAIAYNAYKFGSMSKELGDLVKDKATRDAVSLRDAEERGALHQRIASLEEDSEKQEAEQKRIAIALQNMNPATLSKIQSKWPEIEREVDYMKRRWGSLKAMPAVRPGSYHGREDDE